MNFGQLANAWRKREDEKALVGFGVCYVLEAGGVRFEHATIAAAMRCYVGAISPRLFLRRWWPRTDDGSRQVMKALHWCREKTDQGGYTMRDAADAYRGPRFATETEIPL